MTPTESSAAVYVRLVLAMFFWGGTWVAGRIVVQEAPPFASAFFRFLIATLALAWMLRRSTGSLRLAGGARVWMWTALMGLSGIFAYNYFFMHGMQFISAGRGALVVALNPAVVALVAWLFLREPMNATRACGIALALAGCLLVVSNGAPLALFAGRIGPGELLIVGCVVCWVFYTFLGREATQLASALQVSLQASAVGCVLLALGALGEGSLGTWPDYSFKAWACIAFLGFAGTALGYSWYTEAVQRLGAARAAAFINLVPVFGVLLGALILGERLDAFVLLGGALTIAGVVLTNRAR